MTHNEVRAELGLIPVEGGDVPYVQLQDVPLGYTVNNKEEVISEVDEKKTEDVNE